MKMSIWNGGIGIFNTYKIETEHGNLLEEIFVVWSIELKLDCSHKLSKM